MQSPSQRLSQDISHAPSEEMGWDISTPLHSRPARKYHVPSEHMGQDICTPLHSGLAGKYHVPSKCMGQHICTPLHTGPAGKYHVPSKCMGWDISTPLHSGLARKYHMPSECMGWDISTPLHSRPARKYHMPSECMGRDICITVSTTLSQFGLGLGISKWHSFPFWVPELQNGAEVPLSNCFGTQIYFQHLSPPNQVPFQIQPKSSCPSPSSSPRPWLGIPAIHR